jgi:hypothetical protein
MEATGMEEEEEEEEDNDDDDENDDDCAHPIRSQWPRGLRNKTSFPARTLGS